MKILQKIKKKFGTKTAEKQSQHTQGYWAYKLTVDQVSLIFEAKDVSVFKENDKEYNQFIEEYNELFNTGFNLKKFNDDSLRFKMQLKQEKLMAMHEALSVYDAPNSRKEFELLFSRKYESIEDLKLIVDRYSMLNDKLSMNTGDNDKEGLTFEETIQLVETSRGIPIDRNIKLYSFHVMYNTETKKWQNG